MDLSDQQLDWLAKHFAEPGRAWIKLPPLEQSLLDLGLIKAETFLSEGGFDVIVLSPTKLGWIAAIQYRSEKIERHYPKFDQRFIAKAKMAGVSLELLPEFISSNDALIQDIASIRLNKLLKYKELGLLRDKEYD